MERIGGFHLLGPGARVGMHAEPEHGWQDYADWAISNEYVSVCRRLLRKIGKAYAKPTAPTRETWAPMRR